ncbi:diaminopimelate epimerase, partial [candidate division TA06 bacterium]|nr:diaminopimelate epimerase [candidate division TA06 bacterium]
KTISFTKMSGGGNDFILFDNRERVLKGDLKGFIREICQRRLSVGADGILLLEKDMELDFTMQYYNADGGEVDMCGNGARCIALFAYEKKIAPQEMRFRSKNDIHSARVDQNRVKLQISKPRQIELEFSLKIQKKELTASSIHTGVPHVVLMVGDVGKTDVRELGSEIRNHPRFQPQGTNVDFVQVVNKRELQIRTFERGVEDETLACGTGCVAGTLVSHLTRGMTSPVLCHTRGGENLLIHYQLKDGLPSEVFLEGEVKIVFEGTLTL